MSPGIGHLLTFDTGDDAPEKPLGRKRVSRTATCRQCAAVIAYRSPSRHMRFCNRKCAGIYRANLKRKPQRACPICGVPAPSAMQRCCSKKCADVLRRTLPDRICAVCRNGFRPLGGSNLSKYCSLRCYNSVRSAKAFETFACAKCQKSVSRRRVRTRPRKYRFCSRECSQGFLSGSKNALWRGGGNPNRGAGWVKLAAQIRLRDKYVCRRCGRTQAENGEALAVDHIRPWRSFRSKVAANDPSNLVSLCKKCHGFKTIKLERAWLKGDVLGLQQYEKAVAVTA